MGGIPLPYISGRFRKIINRNKEDGRTDKYDTLDTMNVANALSLMFSKHRSAIGRLQRQDGGRMQPKRLEVNMKPEGWSGDGDGMNPTPKRLFIEN